MARRCAGRDDRCRRCGVPVRALRDRASGCGRARRRRGLSPLRSRGRCPPPTRPSSAGSRSCNTMQSCSCASTFSAGDGIGVVQVAEGDDEAAVFHHPGEFAGAAGECGRFVEAIRAQSMQPKEDLLAGKRAPRADGPRAAADDSHGADPSQRGEREAAGELHGPRVFAHALRGDAHRRGGIDQQIDGQPLGRFVFLHVHPARARRSRASRSTSPGRPAGTAAIARTPRRTRGRATNRCRS
jgi:hypothetical protein